MKDKKAWAWINYSKAENAWILRIWDAEFGWSLSKQWQCKDIDPETGYAWVCDDALCELARMQEMGYRIKITAG